MKRYISTKPDDVRALSNSRDWYLNIRPDGISYILCFFYNELFALNCHVSFEGVLNK